LNVVAAIFGGAVSYLIGSVPFGFLTVKLLAGVDIREHGSGNIGATNVGRFFGGAKGVLVFLGVFLLDVGKGVACAYALARAGRTVTGWSDPANLFGIAYGLSAIAGHVFPVTLRFKGGKAVATSCGVMLSLAPGPTGAAVGVWVLVMALTRYVSLSSMCAALGLVVFRFATCRAPWARENLPLTVMMCLVAALVFARHRSNIRRLIAGTENRIGRRRPGPMSARDSRQEGADDDRPEPGAGSTDAAGPGR